ncbi:MAG: hypothetical protein KDK71_07370, partial [Chlamydiia bacterium]|nr:hypothetical protein [Chlamydiia bacterium]
RRIKSNPSKNTRAKKEKCSWGRPPPHPHEALMLMGDFLLNLVFRRFTIFRYEDVGDCRFAQQGALGGRVH